MKKRILLFALSFVMLLGSVAGINNFTTAYADSTGKPEHVHTLKCKYYIEPTEAKNGIICYYCTGKDCDYFYEEEVPRLPNVYVHKFRHDDAGLCTRITVHQSYKVADGKLDITMADWNATLAGQQYNYNWQDRHIKARSIEFKASDVGIGYFNDKVDNYALTIPLHAVTDCEEDGAVVVYLTTGAAMVRLSEEATAALIKDATESIGVVVTRDGDDVSAKLMVDGEEAATPDGVEMLYWVKDAGDKDTLSEEVANSEKYMNFALEGDFDLIYVESLSA